MPYNTTRIAKNTLMLYFRQLVLMLVNLYTVRVILNTLGAEDYGIYNIVGGVVVLFSFLDSAMTTATQRFLNYALGQENTEYARDVFSISFTLKLFLSLFILIFAETIGLVIFYKVLNIPADREFAAFIAYQLSILITIFKILRIPYHATIIAHEKMSFFAFISIIEGVLLLGIAFLLMFAAYDKLVIYSILLVIVSLIIFFIYKIYCNKSYSIAHFRFCKNKDLYKQFTSFSGWSLLSGIANMGRGQGINILLNMFFGVAVNAAMGVANQVNTAVYQFVNNYQLAFKPQIIKSYAAKEYDYFMRLIFLTSKTSFYLLFFFVLPLYINAEFVLTLWLKNVPDYAVVFTRLILIFSLTEAIIAPLITSMNAHGDIKRYRIIYSFFVIASLPVSYILLIWGSAPEYVIITKLLLNITFFIWFLFFLKNKINLPVLNYFFEVILPVVFISVISFLFICLISKNLFGWKKLFLSTLSSSISIVIFVLLFGVNMNERIMIWKIFKNKLNRNKINKKSSNY